MKLWHAGLLTGKYGKISDFIIVLKSSKGWVADRDISYCSRKI
jgi:hypothetical protein